MNASSNAPKKASTETKPTELSETTLNVIDIIANVTANLLFTFMCYIGVGIVTFLITGSNTVGLIAGGTAAILTFAGLHVMCVIPERAKYKAARAQREALKEKQDACEAMVIIVDAREEQEQQDN